VPPGRELWAARVRGEMFELEHGARAVGTEAEPDPPSSERTFVLVGRGRCLDLAVLEQVRLVPGDDGAGPVAVLAEVERQ
jgi:hypothetical protein